MDFSEADVRRSFQRPRRTLRFGQNAADRFHKTCVQYFANDPTEHYVLRHPEKGRFSYRVRLKTPFPDLAEEHFSASLQHIRNAYDQAVHAARSLTSPPPIGLQNFPWAKNPSDLAGKRRNFDPRIWDVFEAFQPYPASKAYLGGDSLVRAIASLVNRKHDVGLEVEGSPHGVEIDGFAGGGSITVSPNWNPVTRETIVCEWGENPNALQTPPAMTFAVLIAHAGVPKGTRALEALVTFHNRALELITALEARCIAIHS